MAVATAPDAIMEDRAQNPPTVSGTTLCAEPSDVETAAVGVMQERTLSIDASAIALLQSFRNAGKAGITLDDEYVALIKRYTNV